MKKHLLTTIGVALLTISLMACTKAKKQEATPPAPEGTEGQGAAVTQPTTAGQTSMLEHLKAVNKKMCETIVKEKPEKTVDDCVTELNKLSELNPQNETTMVSKANSEKCVKSLEGVSGSDVMVKSVEGDCAMTALQGQ